MATKVSGRFPAFVACPGSVSSGLLQITLPRAVTRRPGERGQPDAQLQEGAFAQLHRRGEFQAGAAYDDVEVGAVKALVLSREQIDERCRAFCLSISR